jgi:hypothetical protein
MWLSKITYDLVAARKNCQEFLGLVQVPISAKRIQLQAKYGGGDGVAVNWTEVLESDIPTLTTLRSWPIKLAAQEHVDFAIFQADYITATVEEQV